MKRSIRALAVILGCCTAAWAAGHVPLTPAPLTPAPLTSIRAIQTLTNKEANRYLPVDFEATVTFFLASEGTLFVQDGNAAIYVFPTRDASFVPGDRVRVTGTTHADFSPSVVGKTITLLHHGTLPPAEPATYDEMIRNKRDCILVTVRAVIRTVDVQFRNDTRDPNAPMHTVARVQMLAEGGYFEALVVGGDAGSLSDLLDAEVEVTGVASYSFDGKMQPIGIVLDVIGRASVKPVTFANASPWSLPATPMDSIVGGYHVRDLTQRVRVHGTITYYQPGTAVVIQDGAKSLWISTLTRETLRIGDVADAIGFPEAQDGHLALTHAEVRDREVWAPIPTKPANVKKLMASENLFDLVSVEGEVATSVREAAQDEYVLKNDGQLFTAIYRHPEGMFAPMKQIPEGARVRVIGICSQEESNRFIALRPVEILLRTPDDIAVVESPSVVNTRNLIIIVALLLTVLFGVGARGWFVERRVRHQTAEMAYIEQRRGQILEKVNSSRPLASTIEEITELVSCKLKGAPSWCQIEGGARLGNAPAKLASFRVIEAEIPARSGPALGSMFAALDARTKPRAIESQALSMATALAALAIETHRLYSDLLHRSDFDLLTDTLNRFSLDKRLDELIANARDSAGLIGLIYVDLDRFKQVNDSHGHQIGDLYLQEVSQRMKRQLRSADSLARIGGDEFAVLLPDVHSREDVEEIALRLEQCLDEPFTIESVTLHGSASVGIAVYPADATNKDLLFRVADTAMYAAKNQKRRIEVVFAGGRELEPVPKSRA
jgi:diguanylate cyclase (GGDEF)-like protein